MSAPPISYPCLPPPVRAGRRREPVAVVEILATGGIGGAQRHVASLVERLDRQRFRPHVVSLSDGPGVRWIEDRGVPVVVLHQRDDDDAAGALAGILVALQPTVVHNHMYRAEVVGTKASLRAVAMGMARPFIISTVHSSRVRRVPERAVLAGLTREMDRLVAVSRSIARKIEREGRRGASVVLIPNGVDVDRLEAQSPSSSLRAELGLAPESPLVGVIARIEPEKGHPTLLDAWPLVLRAVPGARLVIVGEGSRRAALEEYAGGLGLLGGGSGAPGRHPAAGRRAGTGALVVFAGRREDVPAVIAALDVAVLPSYREAQGIFLLEAMALARPIVASRVGGIPEFVEDGVSGLLVPPRDPGPLAEALVRLLGDRALRATLGRNAREVVRERYRIELMMRQVEDLYEEGAAAQAALAARQRLSA